MEEQEKSKIAQDLPDGEEQLNLPDLTEEEPDESIEKELLFEEPFQKEKIGWSTSTVTILLSVVFLVLAGIGIMIWLLPGTDGHVMINELMSSNDRAYLHPEYGSVDWIELYNPTGRDIDLSGYGLTNELKKQYKYRFPDGTVIPSGEYLVLYCTGGTSASDSDPYCTGFSLSQEGESVYLVDRSYVEMDEVTLPAMETDSSYARGEDGIFTVTWTSTPGGQNTISGR